MKKYLLVLLHFLLILIAVSLQVSVFELVIPPEYRLNIVYIIILLFIFFNKKVELFAWVLIGGCMLDFYSALPFGLYYVTFVVSVITLYLLFNYLLTNRSDSALILIYLVGIGIYNLLYFLLSYFYSIFNFGTHKTLNIVFVDSIKQSFAIIGVSVLIYIVFKLFIYIQRK